MTMRGYPLAIFLGVSCWFALLGWLVSPWLEMYGLVFLLVFFCIFRPWRDP